MKKTLLLLFALLTGVSGAWAVTPKILAYPEPGKVYYMYAYYSTTPTKAYIYYDGSKFAVTKTAPTTGDFAYLWLCTKDGNNYRFQNLKSNKYLGHKGASQDAAYNFDLNKDVTNNEKCVALYSINANKYNVIKHSNCTFDQADGNYHNTNFSSDFLFEPYAAKVLSHNQYYYIYCDNDDSKGSGTDRKQYLYNGSSSTIPVQIDQSQVSLTNYAWRAQKIYESSYPNDDYFSFKNGTKYLAFHSLADDSYKWHTNKADAYGIGRVMMWGMKDARYMLLKYDDTTNSNSGGLSQTRSYPKSGEWSQDFMFRIAPQTGVYRVAIKVSPDYTANANAHFTFDGVDYDGSLGMAHIYVDNNNLPETKTISVSSYDETEYTFSGFRPEGGGDLTTTIDVSSLSANQSYEAVFTTNRSRVTYHLIYDGEDKGTVSSPLVLSGSTLSIPSSLDNGLLTNNGGFMTYEYYQEADCITKITTVPVGFGNVYAKADTWSGPRFTSNETSPEYYNLTIRGNYLVRKAADNTIPNSASSDAYNPEASWAFIGNPIDGFSVINQAAKTAGPNYYMMYSELRNSHQNTWGEGTRNIVTLCDDDTHKWLLEKNPNGFVLRAKDNPNVYLHQRNSDGLSTCAYVEFSGVHDDDGSTIVASTDEEVLFALYDIMKDYHYGTTIGRYSAGDNTGDYTPSTVNSNIASIGSNIDAENTAAYPAAYAALKGYYDVTKFNTPAAGFYRLKNVETEGYLYGTQVQGYTATTKNVYADGDNNSASTVIYLGTYNNHIYMYNQGYEFGWTDASRASGSGAVAYLRDNSNGNSPHDKYLNWFPGTGDDNRIAFAICYGNGTGSFASYLTQGIYTANDDNEIIAGTDYTDDAAQWIFEDASTVSVTLHSGAGAYYATFCAPFSYTVSGATAYTLAQSGDWLVPTIVDGTVAAGTPVLLKSTTGNTATLTIGSGYAATPLTTTSLTGTYTAATIEGANDYVLGINNGVVGFYHWNQNTLGANRAYLTAESAAASVKGFVINWGDETGVESIEHSPLTIDHEAGTMFDLSGRRVSKAQKGLYIQNGKKVMVK